jgi:hypothetical protein
MPRDTNKIVQDSAIVARNGTRRPGQLDEMRPIGLKEPKPIQACL